MRARHLLPRTVAWSLLAAFILPPSPVAAAPVGDDWARVTALAPGTWVIVRRADDGPAEGPLVSANDRGVTVSARRQDSVTGRITDVSVTVARDRVWRVTVVRSGRPWYAIPLVVGAVVVGAGVMLAAFAACTESNGACNDDSEWGIWALFALPVLTGIWTYRKIGERASLKVIYEAPIQLIR